MNIVELIAEDLKRGVLLFIGMANMVVGGYKCMCWSYWLVTQHIVVIGKWSIGMCGMGGLLFMVKRMANLEQLYEMEKEGLLHELDKAQHKARILRVNHEYDISLIKYTYDTNLCITYNLFDDNMNRVIHTCNQLRINKEIEVRKMG
jgi:hypothetical protein